MWWCHGIIVGNPMRFMHLHYLLIMIQDSNIHPKLSLLVKDWKILQPLVTGRWVLLKQK